MKKVKKKMGDMIQKLPTDNIQMPLDERENFMMLFPEEQQSQQNQQESKPIEKKDVQQLRKEFISIFLFMVVFFLLNVPYVKNLIIEYIPMCNKSWFLTNLVQSIIFAFVLWIIINAEYSRV